jgi:hypothetical protein
MPIFDQYSDPGFTKLASVPGFSKFATDFEAAFRTPPRQAEAYAWKEAGAFPVHTPEDAVFSLLYIVKQARVVPLDVYKTVKEAVAAYGFDPVGLVEEMLRPPRVKEAAADEFLLPEHRRLRVKTASDVDMAVHALERGGRELDVDTLTTASVRLVEKAAAMRMDASRLPAFVFKYAGLVESNPQTLVDWLEARAQASPALEHRFMFDKIATVVRSSGVQRDRTELIKVAQLISEADEAAGLKELYGSRLPDPVLTVFNTEKIAQPGVNLGAGEPVPVRSLMGVAPEVYGDVLGEDFLEQVVDESGQLDPGMLSAVLETLPADMKQQLMHALGPYLT